MGSRKRSLTEADRRAAARLRELWEGYKKINPGITQEKAAEIAGFGQSAFSQFLLGKLPARVTPIVKFAKLFGVAPTDIRSDLPDLPYDGRLPVKKLEAQEPSALSTDAMEIARVFDGLTPQTRELIREHIFIYAVIDHKYPWLRRGRPKGESYNEFERRALQNFAAMLDIEKQGKQRAKSTRR